VRITPAIGPFVSVALIYIGVPERDFCSLYLGAVFQYALENGCADGGPDA